PVLEPEVLGVLPIAQFGSAAQKERWLPRIGQGEAIVTSALVELHRAATDPGTRAKRDGAGWRITGRKIAVPAGPIADAILVPAALDGGGLGVFLVQTKPQGVARTDPGTTSRQPRAPLVLVRLAARRRAPLRRAPPGPAPL